MVKKSGCRKRSASSLLQEAADLRVLCENDKDELIASGLDWSYYYSLQEKTELLQKLHNKVMLYQEDRKCDVAYKNEYQKMCVALRTEMRAYLLNLINMIDKHKRIPAMSRHRSSAAISQDLLDLAICAEDLLIKYPDCCIKAECIEKLRTSSSTLLKISSVPKGPSSDPQLYSQHRFVINELQCIIQLIRGCGKLAFYHNPGRRKAYLCS